MHAKLFSLAALAAVALAAPSGADSNQCSTGPIQCCNSVQSVDSPAVAGLLGLLGVPLGSVTGQVGISCTPISVIGVGGNSCNAQTVCCTNNNFNGVVALGCTPVNADL